MISGLPKIELQSRLEKQAFQEEDVRKKQKELGIKEVLIIHSPFNLSSTLVRRLLKENQSCNPA